MSHLERTLRWLFAGLAILLIGAQTPDDKPNIALMRYLSFVIQDEGPSSDEAKAYARGETDLASLKANWLKSQGHRQRILRFFFDIFGVRSDVHGTMAHLILSKSDEGVWYLDAKDSCSMDTAVQVTTWWSDPGSTELVCPNVISQEISYQDDSGEQLSCMSSWWSMQAGACGCGPNLIACIKNDLVPDLIESVRLEAAWRGLNAYETGLSWQDFIGGKHFFGSRLLYWQYLVSGTMIAEARMPSRDELTILNSLPLLAPALATMPVQNPPRAGVLTMPGFLNQYNEFRRRTRALSERLLCQPISPKLNTDQYTQFRNPDFTEQDLNHGGQSDCAGCHYAMDNLGSLLFGWNPNGYIDTPRPSTIGHAFGVDGEGPGFLAQSIVERGPGFFQCMAVTAWESLTNMAWAKLNADRQKILLDMALKGPRDLLTAVLDSSDLLQLAVAEQATATTTQNVISYDEIAKILQRACGSGGCHDPGSGLEAYAQSEAALRTRMNSVEARLTTTGSGQMPPPQSGRQLSSEEIDLILRFLGKR